MVDYLSSLALPADARLDLAYPTHVRYKTPPAVTSFSYQPITGTLELIVTAQFGYTADALGGTRVLSAVFYDEDNQIIAQIPAPSTLAPSGLGNYLFATGVAAAWTAGSYNAAPLPPIVIQRGFRFDLAAAGGTSGDLMSNVWVNKITIPYGPAPREAAVLPTPLIA